MRRPTTYQAEVIKQRGYDPEIYWVIEWNEDHAVLGDRTRATFTRDINGAPHQMSVDGRVQNTVRIDNIQGFGDDETCRNLANDAEDPTHDYRPQAQGPYGYLPEENANE